MSMEPFNKIEYIQHFKIYGSYLIEVWKFIFSKWQYLESFGQVAGRRT